MGKTELEIDQIGLLRAVSRDIHSRGGGPLSPLADNIVKKAEENHPADARGIRMSVHQGNTLEAEEARIRRAKNQNT